VKKQAMLALACVICVAGALASTAAACHSDIAASIDCNGIVSYTASAWSDSGATTSQRTNSNVAVYWSTDNRTWTQVASGHFGRDNGFQFGGTFSAGSASSGWVKVQELAHWASGDAPNSPRVVQVTKSAGCTSGGSGSTCPSHDMVHSNGSITVANGVATVNYTVASGCKNIQLSLVSYKAPGPTFSESTADQQVLYDSQTQTVSAGSGVLHVAVPSCYYQIDFVYGTPIAHLGPAGSNNFYGKQGRLIDSVNGGTTSCTSGTPPTNGGTPPPPTPQQVSIAVTKTERIANVGDFVQGPIAAKVGQTIQYKIDVVDTGNVMVWVTVADALCDAGTLSSPNGIGIGPTSTATFTCSHVVKASEVGNLVNTVTATGTAANGQSATGQGTAVAQVAAATTATTGVLGATHTVTPAKKTTAKKATAKKAKAKKVVKKHTKAKKVTKKAKPAHAVIRSAHYTG
jgi:hypothetical protein